MRMATWPSSKRRKARWCRCCWKSMVRMPVSLWPPRRFLAMAVVARMVAPPLSQARVQPSSGVDLFSADQELQVGKQAAADTNKQLPVLPDSDPIVQYIQQLGARLVAHAPGQKW